MRVFMVFLLGLLSTPVFAQTPGGGQNAVQYNNASSFAGNEANFSFNGTNVGVGTTNGIHAGLDVRTNGYVAGNLGIGTTGPKAQLHVRKNQNGETNVIVENSTSDTDASAAYKLITNNGNAMYMVLNSANYTGTTGWGSRGVLYTDSGSNGITLSATRSTGDLRFEAGGINERMRVTSTGNVGIGTVAPRTITEIRKDQNAPTALAIYNQTNNTDVTSEVSVVAGPAGNVVGGFLSAYPTSFTGVTGYAGKVAVGAAGFGSGLVLVSAIANSDMRFEVGGYGTSFEKMRLLSTGNLGIGSAAPGATLDVNGNTRLITAGNKFFIKEGTNACIGVATLASGTATVNTTCVTANSRVSLTLQNCSSCGTPYLGTVTAGTSFVINSTNGADASNVYWQIVDKL